MDGGGYTSASSASLVALNNSNRMQAVPHTTSQDHIQSQVEEWLDRVVIAQTLCPFAARPRQRGAIRIAVIDAAAPDTLLERCYAELMKLADSDPNKLETSLLVVPALQSSFADYWEFVGVVEDLLDASPWRGQFQVASFHPDYCFEGSEPSDPANFSNRSPWPIIHLLREDSVAQAVDSHPDVSAIPERNIDLLRSLSEGELAELFPWRPRR